MSLSPSRLGRETHTMTTGTARRLGRAAIDIICNNEDYVRTTARAEASSIANILRCPLLFHEAHQDPWFR